MRYRPYRLNMEVIARIIRKTKVFKLPKVKNLSTMQKALAWTYKNSGAMLGDMEAIIHAEEYYWLSGDKTVYFPESAEMADNIMRGSYTIQSEEALYDGAESFIINLPSGLEFDNNEKGSGLLVVVMPHDDRSRNIIDRFTKWIGIPDANVVVHGDQGKFTIAITYQNIFNSDEYSRVVLPSHGALEFLKMRDLDDYIEHMNLGNAFNSGFKLNRDEYAYQFEMIRLVCGFLVYKKALPERITSGLPGINHKEVETPLTKGQDHHIVKSPSGAKDRTGGYRTWHFRQLRAERFYHGIHKNKPIGSRVVFVSESYAIDDIDAKTVEG